MKRLSASNFIHLTERLNTRYYVNISMYTKPPKISFGCPDVDKEKKNETV